MLDSAFAKASVFRRLSKKAVVKHIRHDFNLPSQAEDSEIYNLAVREKMFVVTINLKHFRKLVKGKCTGVFALDSGLSNKMIDDVICKFISGKNPLDYYGKTTRIK